MASVMDDVRTPGDTFTLVERLSTKGLTRELLEHAEHNDHVLERVIAVIEDDMPSQQTESYAPRHLLGVS